MADMCDDNRFELIEKYKRKLIEATNIETAKDEMAVLNNILFRFCQMGWLESIDRMPLIKESVRTLMNSGGDSASCIAFRNAGRFIQNAIDGEAPDFEKVSTIEPDLLDDETLMMTVPYGMLENIRRVMIDEVGTKFCKVMYQDEPERKKGEWIDLGKDKTIRWQCSECGRKDTHIYNYCPDCGSDNSWC